MESHPFLFTFIPPFRAQFAAFILACSTSLSIEEIRASSAPWASISYHDFYRIPQFLFTLPAKPNVNIITQQVGAVPWNLSRRGGHLKILTEGSMFWCYQRTQMKLIQDECMHVLIQQGSFKRQSDLQRVVSLSLGHIFIIDRCKLAQSRRSRPTLNLWYMNEFNPHRRERSKG